MSRWKRWLAKSVLVLICAVMITMCVVVCWVLVNTAIEALFHREAVYVDSRDHVEHSTTQAVQHAEHQILLDEIRESRRLIKAKCK